MIDIEVHPLVGTILRQIDRPQDRFKVMGVMSGCHRSIWWVSPGAHPMHTPTELTRKYIDLLEIDPNQTDGPIDQRDINES